MLGLVLVSSATSGSIVVKNTCAPSAEIALKREPEKAFGLAGPVETSVVTPLARSYRSFALSTSSGTSDSGVVKITREPSAEAASNRAMMSPLPPVGPIESSSVVPPDRS